MYSTIDAALLRASAHPIAEKLPPWPDLDGVTAEDVDRWRSWIEQVWAIDDLAAAIETASPSLTEALNNVLSRHIDQPREVRRAAVSLVRYLLRMQYRATPFGLFAGPAALLLGQGAEARWGTRHHITARADAEWLDETINALEAYPGLLRCLPVVADPTCIVRGTRVVVPHQPRRGGPSEVTMRRTPAMESVLRLARSPIVAGDMVAKLLADYPGIPEAVVENMLHTLVTNRVLLTSLRAPMTTDDSLGHVMSQLDAAGADLDGEAAATVGRLRQIHQLVVQHDAASPSEQRTVRTEAARRMTAVSRVTDRPLVINLRPDCEVVLPTSIAREAERALAAMARMSPFPSGPPAWQDYRARFLERYSMGALVPVRDLVDPGIGLGYPAGYRTSLLKRPVLATSSRDEHLLTLAQDAALNRAHEAVLTEEDFDALAVGEFTQVPAHVELCFSVLAPTLSTIQDGRFELSVVGLSQAAGTTAGRFLTLLDAHDRARMSTAYASLPTLDAEAIRAQVSCPPMRIRTQNVSRAPVVLPRLLALGEHSHAATLDLDDLAVGADAQRLFLVSLSTGERIEPSVMNAVELTNATHPLVRFLCESHRAHAAVLAPFSWGAAARMPFLPRVRFGRTVLSPACWRLRQSDVAGEGRPPWHHRFTDWRCRLGVTRTVYIGSDDQQLRLDLDEPAHVQLLRAELERTGTVTVHEAPGDDAYGWLDGRAHEITMPFASTLPPAAAPRTGDPVVLRRDGGRLPGTSAWAYVKLYGHPDRVPEILTTHLPALLGSWDSPPPWWFTRYSDPGTHLRLRLYLPSPHVFGDVAQRLGTWAAALRHDGLISRVQWDTDEPETGRYGTGSVLNAAEQVFTADSTAAVAQMVLAVPRALRPAVTAASFIDLTAGFVEGPASGRRWLVKHFLKGEGSAPARDVQVQVARLSSPDGNFAGLRALPGGEDVVEAWRHRREALALYRTSLMDSGADPAAVLPSLLHMHHNRAAGIDTDAEATCRRMARAAALSWTAQRGGGPK
ncbi:lantibiotic dehydratase [Streptomyces sp. NPDC127033]|uniref:lantibiotic dehydratase n=1 Tax=Streptomyces sp. NPDC127033 TaxID=3347110 RepID=UPI003664E489